MATSSEKPSLVKLAIIYLPIALLDHLFSL